MIIFTYLNIALLMAIAIVHLYWAMGGKKGIDKAIPSHPDGRLVFQPEQFGALAVAVALICFAYLHYVYIRNNDSIKQLAGYLLLTGAVVFLIRVVGEMKYTGLFKKVRNTPFARYDNYLYMPLCLIISICSFITYSYSAHAF